MARNNVARSGWHHSQCTVELSLPSSLEPFRPPPDRPLKLPVTRSRTRQRLLAGLCAAALCVPAAGPGAWAQNTLPALGDAASEGFGVGAERKLGDQIMREIRRDPDYLDDPLLLEYLHSVFQPLVTAARQRGEIGPDVEQRFAWEAFLVRDRSVNAFALPGGYVGVHLGLIAMTATRDELASVLAHELSHVTQRHIARGFANSRRQSLIGAAAFILGVIAASRSSNADAANALMTGGQAAAVQGMLNFSRDMEREADRIGLGIMTSAGFAPGGMAAMFEKMAQSSRLNDSGAFPYLRTHPLTSERIGEARARLGVGAAAAPVSVLEHSAAQARARVLMDTHIDALRRWQALDGSGSAAGLPEQLAAAYSSALASTLLRDWERADTALRKATGLLPSGARSDTRAERALALLGVQMALERGDVARAESALGSHAGDGSRAVALLSARLALAGGASGAAAKRSADELQTWVTAHPRDAAAWGLLGQLWGQLGQPLRGLRAEAESRLALGDLMGAVDRLRAGQRLARSGQSADFIEASVIDARLRDVEALRRQLAAEERQGG